ncbi:hypothetical protein EBU99_12765 [bacterium]|nr:hypothetical protein [bacterium]
MSEENNSTEGSAKVLPFKRPSPQPTLTRRPGAVAALRAHKGKTQGPQSKWKGRLVQGLQLGLLALGAILALKNCGKI